MTSSSRSSAAVAGSLRMPRSSMMSSGTVASSVDELLARAVERAPRRAPRGARAPRGRARGGPAGWRRGRSPGRGGSCRCRAVRGRARPRAARRSAPVASSKTSARFIFLLKSKSKVSSVLPASRKRGLLDAAARASRSWRRMQLVADERRDEVDGRQLLGLRLRGAASRGRRPCRRGAAGESAWSSSTRFMLDLLRSCGR